MPVIVSCPQCQQQLHVSVESLGKAVSCPACSEIFTAAISGASPAEEQIPTEATVAQSQEEHYQGELPFGETNFPDREFAREQVQGPAKALLISGILSLVLAVFSIVINIVIGLLAFQEVNANNKPEADILRIVGMTVGIAIGVVQGIAGIINGALIIKGAQKMKRLESYGWAMISAILSIVPFVTCCFVSTPVGIWALIVLLKPEVKSAFEG